ncbi:PAS domain-containing protein [Polyangium aurulentum]|uniref:PAS domain-containing protein n=1 Tax=Polyangium aurulentum TaxID=2567896 RepID=UPI0010AE65E6|nr:PAS domain-containing protein [Polyangium aurulentum]UQA56355.1 PAS domain-containing protein [Polyangium aurulentum]
MTDTRETVESLRAALEAAEARAELAEARADALEALIARVPAMLLELGIVPGASGLSPVSVGGAGMEAILGYAAEDFTDVTEFWREHVHPDDFAMIMEAAEKLFATGEAATPPHRVRHKDGSEVWLEGHNLLLRREDGTPERVHTILFDVTERRRSEREARELLQKERFLRHRLDGFMANVPGIVWENYFVHGQDVSQANFVSDRIESISGYTAEEWRAPNFWLEIIHPDDRDQAMAASHAIIERGQGAASYRWVTKDGRTLWMRSWMMVIRDEEGVIVGLRGVTMDVTDLTMAEMERAETRMREARLEAREESLLALSTPLVPIDDDLLAMPLVGTIDGKRAERVIETLLDGVSRSGARAVILDVTGVPAVEQGNAEAILRAARAVSLLGAEVVLTGIRPEVARTLVALDADLGTIVTRGTLKAGIAYAMGRRRGRG